MKSTTVHRYTMLMGISFRSWKNPFLRLSGSAFLDSAGIVAESICHLHKSSFLYFSFHLSETLFCIPPFLPSQHHPRNLPLDFCASFGKLFKGLLHVQLAFLAEVSLTQNSPFFPDSIQIKPHVLFESPVLCTLSLTNSLSTWREETTSSTILCFKAEIQEACHPSSSTLKGKKII